METSRCIFFKFLLAMNDRILMGDTKSDPNAKLSWVMPSAKEYYNFKGKFYIASAPIQVKRIPPPKIMENDEDYWETRGFKQWNELDKKTRATFTSASENRDTKDSRYFILLSDIRYL